jgi:predicted nucleotidyltransferase
MIMIITGLTIHIEDEVEDTEEDTKGDTKATIEDIREDIKNLARRDAMSASIKDAGQISIL